MTAGTVIPPHGRSVAKWTRRTWFPSSRVGSIRGTLPGGAPVGMASGRDSRCLRAKDARTMADGGRTARGTLEEPDHRDWSLRAWAEHHARVHRLVAQAPLEQSEERPCGAVSL